MSITEELIALKKRFDIIERKLDAMTKASGMTTEEQDEVERQALVDHYLQTGDPKPLQEFERGKNMRSGCAA